MNQWDSCFWFISHYCKMRPF